MSSRTWHGRDWQEYCLELLRLRYSSHDLQEVPDRDRGDLGIEAFSLDGCAFQCYAAEEPLSTTARYEKQRDKLTADLGKLKSNASEFSGLLGTTKILRYVFVVPIHDSRRLIDHAQSKAAEVRSWQLDFVSEAFEIVVVTDDYYSQERRLLLAVPEQAVAPATPSPVDVTDWGTQNVGLLDHAHRKLGALGQSGEGLEAAKEALVVEFLEGENALELLRERFPEQWSTAVRIRSRKERRLAVEHPPGSGLGLNQVTSDLAAQLAAEIPTLSTGTADCLAWSAVSDWVLRCPLEFETSGD